MSKPNPYLQKSLRATHREGEGKSVLVGLTGSRDSALCALILQEQGYHVVACLLKTRSYSQRMGDGMQSDCHVGDQSIVESVTKHLRLPLEVIDAEDRFEADVLDPMINRYLQGYDFNSCVRCHSQFRMNRLFQVASELNVDFVATGHQARIQDVGGQGPRLFRSKEITLDQSYLLHGLKKLHLSRLLLPVGTLKESDMNRISREHELPLQTRNSKRGMCFSDDADYTTLVIDRVSPSQRRKGLIITKDNRVLTDHLGVYKFARGSKRGLSGAHAMALAYGYENVEQFVVTRIDAIKGHVQVGQQEDLRGRHIVLGNVNWLSIPDLRVTRSVSAQLKPFGKSYSARAQILGGMKVELIFDDANIELNPGYAVALYDDQMLLGGGLIEELVA